MTRLERRRMFTGWAFISPWFIGLVALTLYPFLASLYYSFTNFNILQRPTWVGWTNYVNMFHDERFVISLGNTVYYAVTAVPLGVILGILVALLLNQRLAGTGVARTLMYVPSIVPVVAMSIVWLWMLNPQYGVINLALRALGLHPPAWLSDPAWAKPALVLMAQWGMGQAVLIYLSGIQSVPRDLYEVADLDGASSLRKFFSITLPQMSPVILYNVIMGMIGCFQYFTQVYVMTSGGPVNSTLFYSLYLFQQAFQNFRMGYASALAWVMFLIVAVLTALIFRTSARHIYYGGEE